MSQKSPLQKSRRGFGSHKNRFRSKRPQVARSKPGTFRDRRKKSMGHLYSSHEKRQQAWSKTDAYLRAQNKDVVRSVDLPTDSLTQRDPWQQKALDALFRGSHVVVDAPTTAGKTRIVEAYLRDKIDQGELFRACYTCPVKSLANDKFREMKALFGDQLVGISTGDIKHNLAAPIIIATLESYRNSLLGRESSLAIDLVIFDEYHYIQDYSRGSAWQEAIILSHSTTQLLLLSASVANSEDFVRWIQGIHSQKTVLISTSYRPVPLKNLVFDGKKWILEDYLPKNISPTSSDGQIVSAGTFAAALRASEEAGLTPTIIYTGKRLATEKMARVLAHTMPPLTESARAHVKKQLQGVLKKHQNEEWIDPRFRRLVEDTGIAYHHSGLPPSVRATVESLLKEGIIRICVATSGLSLGINFSVKSTIIADKKRPGDQGMERYSASDVLQMTGRAGRRGKDLVGYSLWPSLSHYQSMAHTERDSIHPSIRHDPTTFLGLIDKGYPLTTIADLYNRSFQKFFSGAPADQLICDRTIKPGLPDTLPCDGVSVGYCYASYKKHRKGRCRTCQWRKPCHNKIRHELADSSLAKLHFHLHSINALGASDQLTGYGKIAKYLPHSGGLFVARLISSDQSFATSIEKLTEVMACFSLAHYKSPLVSPTYSPPTRSSYLRKSLARLYPEDLFSYLYEKKAAFSSDPSQQPKSQFIEYHPGAGYIICRWMDGASWKDLVREVTHNYFAEGDLFTLIYKVANYLQSLYQAGLGPLSSDAKELRTYLLRSPLDFSSHDPPSTPITTEDTSPAMDHEEKPSYDAYPNDKTPP